MSLLWSEVRNGTQTRSDLGEIGRLEFLPCRMANRENPHSAPLFIDFINDSINAGNLAIKQVPQLSFHGFGSVSWKTAVSKTAQPAPEMIGVLFTDDRFSQQKEIGRIQI
jgi:hypothetical protein